MGENTHKNAEILIIGLIVAVACALLTFACCFALGCKLTHNPIIVWFMLATSLLTGTISSLPPSGLFGMPCFCGRLAVISFATGFIHGVLISIKFQECPSDGPCVVKAASLGYSCIACMPGLLMSLTGLYVCLRAVRLSKCSKFQFKRRIFVRIPDGESQPFTQAVARPGSRKTSSLSVTGRNASDDSLFSSANPHFRAGKLTRAHVPMQPRSPGGDGGRLLASLEFAKRPVARHAPLPSNHTPVLTSVPKTSPSTPTVVRNLTANPLLMTWEEQCASAPPGVTQKPQPAVFPSIDKPSSTSRQKLAEDHRRKRKGEEDRSGDTTAAVAMTGNTDAACCCMIAFL